MAAEKEKERSRVGDGMAEQSGEGSLPHSADPVIVALEGKLNARFDAFCEQKPKPVVWPVFALKE